MTAQTVEPTQNDAARAGGERRFDVGRVAPESPLVDVMDGRRATRD